MRVVLELNGEPKEDDLILFIDGKWKIVSKNVFLQQEKEELKNTNKRIDDLQNQLQKALGNINEKLKDYHNILQVIVKEE